MRKELILSVYEFDKKMNEIFIKLFKSGVNRIILDTDYLIQDNMESIRVKEIYFDPDNKKVFYLDKDKSEYKDIKELGVCLKYELLDMLVTD